MAQPSGSNSTPFAAPPAADTQDGTTPQQEEDRQQQDPGLELLQLLTQAFPGGPCGSVPGGDPAAAVVLGLHCVMVAAGFQPDASAAPGATPSSTARAPAGSSSSRNSWALSPGWHGAHPDQWLLSYTRPGCLNPFTLFCSLQRASGRLLVNGLEAHNLPANSHYLGLLVPKYVPDPTALTTSSTWAGVLAHPGDLASQLDQFIIQPLLAAAMPLLDQLESSADLAAMAAGGGGSAVSKFGAWLMPAGAAGGGSGYVWAAVVVTAVVVAGVAVYSRQRRGGGSWRLR